LELASSIRFLVTESEAEVTTSSDESWSRSCEGEK